MSVMRAPVDIQCDGCGYRSENLIEWTARAARTSLRRAGWATQAGGVDYCPTCRKERGI